MSVITEKRSIAEYFTTERSRLVRYARRLIDDTADRDGEDIIQDVALSLFTRCDISEPIEHLSGYVYQAVRNRVSDYLRRRREVVSLNQALTDDADLTLADVLTDPVLNTQEQMDRAEIRRRVYEAIEELADDQKAVVIATEFEGRSFKELSREWEVPVGTLLARKSRAMSKVKAALQDLRS